jgi:hypothetical protein
VGVAWGDFMSSIRNLNSKSIHSRRGRHGIIGSFDGLGRIAGLVM